jgi:geranyl diphosphate 2-C-methyltransferase
MTVDVDRHSEVVRTAYERDLNEHWEDKQNDPINLLLGQLDGLYHHHYAVGEFNRRLLTAPEHEREGHVLRELHRMENDQVSLVLDALTGLSPHDRVLDAGSGRGGTSFMMYDRYGCRVDGVNFCTHHIAFAERLARQRACADKVAFHYANMARTPFEDRSFDAVVTNETTMYVDLFETFREFARLLVPGGRYVLVTWCANDAAGGPEAAPEVAVIDAHYVCHIHRRSTYFQALAANGLVPSRVFDLTAEAVPYWELRSQSRLRTGVEAAFLAGYRRNVLNYLVIAAERVGPA